MISNTVKQLELLHHYCAQDSYHNGNAQQGHNSSDCFTVFDIMLYSSLFQSFLWLLLSLLQLKFPIFCVLVVLLMYNMDCLYNAVTILIRPKVTGFYRVTPVMYHTIIHYCYYNIVCMIQKKRQLLMYPSKASGSCELLLSGKSALPLACTTQPLVYYRLVFLLGQDQ